MREIIISKIDNKSKRIVLIENGMLIEQYIDDSAKRLEGNIYIGKVQNVLQGMQAAFIDIGEKKNTFIHLKDLLPKTDNNNEEDDKKYNTIKDILRPGMKVLVQVKRDSTNKKGAKVSTHISITTRYSVFMPNTEFITISQRLEKEKEKKRLINIYKKYLPEGAGAIIRTSANGKSEEEIKKDIQKAINIWKDIKKKESSNRKYPILVYESEHLLKRFLVDIIDQDVTKIIIDDKKILIQVEEILEELGCLNSIELELGKDVLNKYDIQGDIEKMSSRKIWLKCGGFITIDRTEALTAIDVNSGKYIGSKSLEQTVYLVNKEASIEIAKQIRLRDIGGIIVIDYIDMKDSSNKEKIVQLLEENFKKDRSKTQIIGFTKLNLFEMTRKHKYSRE